MHPGGPDKILSICGSDGSSVFNTQHGGQQRQADELKNFYIGDLFTQ
jgi:cytochrome b involved in lipid metabolism